MTRAQQEKVNMIRRDAEKLHLHRSGEYEIKRFEVNEHPTFVSVVAEVGLKGDEGTMAAIFCRDHVHVFIGPGGRVTYPCNDGRRKHGYNQVERPYESFLGTVIAQSSSRMRLRT